MFRTNINQRLSSDGESNKQQRHIFLAVAVVAILSLTAFLLETDIAAPPQDFVYSLDADENSRRLARNFDAHSTIPGIKRTITVHLAVGGSRSKQNPANSIFLTDTLPKYGTGRVQFLVRDKAECDYSCNADTHQQPGFLADSHFAPCLAVGRDKGVGKCPHEHLKCNYPTCKTMVTNDELCKHHFDDVREYYSSTIPNSIYLPLGPRLDAWTSFQIIQSSPHFFIKQASERKYAFNAIFSQSTNDGRERLAKVIKAQEDKTALPIFTNMAKKWTSDVNNPRTEQLDTNSYMNAVLDSVFTLSPAGHNPECYRLFEAVEAGSIPVFVKKDLYVDPKNRASLCRGSLHDWYDAPILVLDSWDDLYTTIENVMGDLEALDEMQRKLRTWYDEYMRKVIRTFEDFMIDSYGLEDESVEESSLTHKLTENVVTVELAKARKLKKRKRRKVQMKRREKRRRTMKS